MKLNSKEFDNLLNENKYEKNLDKEMVKERMNHFYEQEKKESKRQYGHQDPKRKMKKY